MVKGLIVGHRNLGESLLATVEKIIGKTENISFLSNDNLSANEMADIIKDLCNYDEPTDTLIFCDLFGGSCWRAARMARIQRSFIITGVNLPMLLSFFNKRDNVPFDDLATVLSNDAVRGINIEKGV